MAWSLLHGIVRRLSGPLRFVISVYVLMLVALCLTRVLRVSGIWLADVGNSFAPYGFMPLALTFPLSIIVGPRGGGVKRGRFRGRAYWLGALQIGLMAVGLYWFAWPGRYKAIVPPIGETFTVVTYNVEGGNVELEGAVDWLLGLGADVIVLQETAAGYDGRLERLYDGYGYEAHTDDGVRIFSRYGILEREVLLIEEEPGRQALRLLLDADGRELAVYGAHIVLPREDWEPSEHGFFDMLLRYDEGRRNAQIRSLLGYAREEDGPRLVVGDFNMSDSSLIYEEIAAELVDGYRSAGAGAGRTWPVAEAIGWPRVVHPLLRIDYLWHSEGLRAVEASVGEAIGSDHLPARAVFAWGEKI